jgi:hypothetical protein
MIGDALDDLVQVGLGIDAVHAGRTDQAIHRRGRFAARIGTGEEIVAPFYGHVSQCPLGDQVVNFSLPVAATIDERRPGIR